MLGTAPWVDFLFGKVALGFATMALTIAGFTSGENRPWSLIVAGAGFILLHTVVNAAREASIVQRLGRNYDQVQSRAVRVISDLGQIAGDQFGFWIVDLYLQKYAWSFIPRYPFVQRNHVLSRELSVSLVHKHYQPGPMKLSSDPHGKCFAERQPLLWYDQIAHETLEDNAWETFDSPNHELEKKYGVLAVSPLVDDLGKECVGVLAIHVGPKSSDAFKALSALKSPHGLRNASDACADLNRLLTK